MTTTPKNLPNLPPDLHKPPIFPVDDSVEWIGPGTHFKLILKLINQEKTVCLIGTYGFVMSFYSWLKQWNNQKNPNKDYASSRLNKLHMSRLTAYLMIRITHQKPTIEKAPAIPWINDFYSGQDDFLLRFVDFLGMNGAWQWYANGIKFPVLDEKLHPFYGTYFPTRYGHLILFKKWLQTKHAFSKALDMGTGCGLLSLMMLKQGIPFVHATDINPNAVYSAQNEMTRRNLQAKTIVEQAAWTGSYQSQGKDLIVFNPPWIPQSPESMLDAATYYNSGFFETLFELLYEKMTGETTLVLLFSTFAQAANISSSHPIAMEIQVNNRFLLVEKINESVNEKPSKTKTWLSVTRQKEMLELWVLRKNPEKQQAVKQQTPIR
jgi:2-polyprenyl-3-methyl-5-hydroxy-6-metoxy-1,4-benzoquinol methylase